VQSIGELLPFAPEWLTIEEACFLSGWSESAMKEIIEEAGVNLNDEGLIERESLYEFNECTALILHWND
jgi:hypothetical protein